MRSGGERERARCAGGREAIARVVEKPKDARARTAENAENGTQVRCYGSDHPGMLTDTGSPNAWGLVDIPV